MIVLQSTTAVSDDFTARTSRPKSLSALFHFYVWCYSLQSRNVSDCEYSTATCLNLDILRM